MTLVTEGGREMNIEEKKDPSRNVKGGIEMRKLFIIEAERDGIGCGNCPFADTRCGADKEVHDLFEEVWAEEHGYVKKENQHELSVEKNLAEGKIVTAIVSPDIAEKLKKNFVNCMTEVLQEDNNDPINPDHYKHGEMQTIERMMTLFGPKKVKTFCEVNALKYLDRAGYKGNALIDHQKADWYLRLARKLGDTVTISYGMDILKKFLKEEEEKNGRNSD